MKPDYNMTELKDRIKEDCLRIVYKEAFNSPDPRTKIGAILTKNGNIIVNDHNSFPAGIQNIEDRWKSPLKQKYVCHAEAGTILTSAKFGLETVGTVLYTQGIPCSSCCLTLIKAGIKRVVVHRQWLQHEDAIDAEKTQKRRWESMNLLMEANVELDIVDVQLNTRGLLDGQEVEV